MKHKKMTAVLFAATMVVSLFGAAPTTAKKTALLPDVSITASAASQLYAPSLNGSNYINWQATSGISVFTTTSLNSRGSYSSQNKGGRKNYNASVDRGDNCRIYQLTNRYAYIGYPTGSGMRYGYVATSGITSLRQTANAFRAAAGVNTYTTSGLGTRYGSIDKGDTCWLLDKSGSSYQMVYPVSGNNYKIGWVSSGDYSRLRNTVPNTSAVEYPLRNARCSWSGYNSSTWSWSENRYGSGHTNERVYHLGLDLKGDSTVYACTGGTVVACSSSNKGANGRYVIVQHSINGKKCYSFYAHLSSVSVKTGQSVSTQTKLGVIGGSGYGKNNYYGTHLHFAIVDTLWSGGGYYGYSTKFSGNTRTFSNVTYYNPKYVVEHNSLP